MKALIVNTYDINGGAARAAYRLHQGLQKIGVQSQMLVQKKNSTDSNVISLEFKGKRMWAALRSELDAWPVNRYKNKSQGSFSSAWLPFAGAVKMINSSDVDVVHLHWIAGGFLRPEDIAQINKPIIWSLHDMWPFTGGCHYDEGCGSYQSGCGKCPMLSSVKSKDLSRNIYIRKEKAFANISNMTVVGLSKWMAKQAASSPLLGRFPVVNLPNPIDVDNYAPIDRAVARNILKLPVDGKLVAFGAMNAVNDLRKGYAQLTKALENIKDTDLALMIFGSSSNISSFDFGFPVYSFGDVNDDVSLRLIYSAADVLVVPSLQENLSNMIMECLSCGTPVVGFDIGGNVDLIDHKKNGYLASPFSSSDLAQGIHWILNNEAPSALRESARAKVLSCFEMKDVAEKYKMLYSKYI